MPMDSITLPTHEERTMLRESVRGLLEEHWPAAGAVERATDAAQVRAITSRLAEQGILALGTDPSEGGLHEILVVQEELGRAGCPAPVLATTLANLLLTARHD